MSDQRSIYLSIILGQHQMSREDYKKEKCYDSSSKFSPDLQPFVVQRLLDLKLSVNFETLNEFFFCKPYTS